METPEQTFDDHINGHGLLCAGRKACPYCRRCTSCSFIYPGRPHADVCSTPRDCMEPICDDCARWLKSIEALKATSPSVEQPKRSRRSTLAP
jgi:hypothetical protein